MCRSTGQPCWAAASRTASAQPVGSGVEVGAGADDGGAHLDRVVEHGEPVGPGDAGEQPGHGDGGQLGEAADRPACLEDGLHGAEALHVADAYVRAERGGAVAELEQGGLGGAALDVGRVGGDGTGGVGGEGEVAVGVRLGGGGEEQVAAEVDAQAERGEAAGGADGLDAAAPEADVDGAAVGERGPGQQDVGAARSAG